MDRLPKSAARPRHYIPEPIVHITYFFEGKYFYVKRVRIHDGSRASGNDISVTAMLTSITSPG
jgi:hypothetical protein